MRKDPDKLRAVQDSLWESGKYLPKETENGEITYCNLAVQDIFRAFGYDKLEGLNADEIMAYVKASSEFLIKPIKDGQTLVNEGTLLIAGLTSEQLKHSHGHVVTLTPGIQDFSGHWQMKVPVCLSIGRKGINWRSRGINYAFVPQPEIYAWVDSL